MLFDLLKVGFITMKVRNYQSMYLFTAIWKQDFQIVRVIVSSLVTESKRKQTSICEQLKAKSRKWYTFVV